MDNFSVLTESGIGANITIPIIPTINITLPTPAYKLFVFV